MQIASSHSNGRSNTMGCRKMWKLRFSKHLQTGGLTHSIIISLPWGSTHRRRDASNRERWFWKFKFFWNRVTTVIDGAEHPHTLFNPLLTLLARKKWVAIFEVPPTFGPSAPSVICWSPRVAPPRLIQHIKHSKSDAKRGHKKFRTLIENSKSWGHWLGICIGANVRSSALWSCVASRAALESVFTEPPWWFHIWAAELNINDRTQVEHFRGYKIVFFST